MAGPFARRCPGALPGFRNIVVHEYVSLDYERVLDALDRLEPVGSFAAAVAGHLLEEHAD